MFSQIKQKTQGFVIGTFSPFIRSIYVSAKNIKLNIEYP